MHILHILDHSIPLHSGYAFRSVAILREQRRLGWQTSQLTGTKHFPYVADHEDVNGFRFFRTRPVPPWLGALPVVNQWAGVEQLSRRIADLCELLRPDIIHAHSPCLNGIAALRVGRRIRIPVAYEVRASWEDAATHHGTTREGSIRYRLSRGLETYVLRHVDAVTTICHGLREDLLARGIRGSSIEVVPNAVDVSHFEPGPADEKLRWRLGLTDKTVIGFAGSFYRYEGLDLLLQAMPRILAARPDVRLLLIGGGPEEQKLRDLATNQGISDHVRFAGRIPHDDISAYYSLVDLFVYPRVSSRLTEIVTPLKPLEAMANRRLVVASDVGGHRELILDGKTGILFRAGCASSLAGAVLGALADHAGRDSMIQAARKYVERERSWQGSVSRYASVYRNLIQTRTNPGVHKSLSE